MKLIINKNSLSMNPVQFARQAGYGFIRDGRTGQESLVRRLGNNFYPRLHLYVEENGDRISFNLHLDQKQASYEGSARHNGEYDGEVVENEIARLKGLISHGSNDAIKTSQETGELLDKVGGNRNIAGYQPREKEKPWWKFW